MPESNPARSVEFLSVLGAAWDLAREVPEAATAKFRELHDVALARIIERELAVTAVEGESEIVAARRRLLEYAVVASWYLRYIKEGEAHLDSTAKQRVWSELTGIPPQDLVRDFTGALEDCAGVAERLLGSSTTSAPKARPHTIYALAIGVLSNESLSGRDARGRAVLAAATGLPASLVDRNLRELKGAIKEGVGYAFLSVKKTKKKTSAKKAAKKSSQRKTTRGTRRSHVKR